MSPEERLHEALVVPRRGRVTLPDSEIVDRPDWVQITTPSIRFSGMNEVLLAVVDPDGADAAIDATIARYRRTGVGYKWCVGPDSAPADLGARLERRGLETWMCRAMARPTTSLGGPPPDAVTVEVVDGATLPQFVTTLAEGWGTPLDETDRIQRRALAGDPPTFFFLARTGGRPSGAAGYVAYPRSAYFIAAVVLPAYRGRGVYRALLDARLAHAASRGLPLATTQAREATSAPLLERLGFETLCRFPIYAERAAERR